MAGRHALTEEPSHRPRTSALPPPRADVRRGAQLASLRAQLELPVVRRTAGLLDGRHRSVLQGHGQDFDDLSLYAPGDDVGDIDWKSSARAGIPVIKRFVRQSNLTVVLAVDTGRAMAATSASGERKGDVAVHTAALVAYLARDRGDRVALVAADAGRITQLPARGGTEHLELLLRHVERAYSVAAPASDVERLLGLVSGRFARRSLVVLITEEARPAPEHARVLRTLRTRHEVMVVSVADADPFAAPDRQPQARTPSGRRTAPSSAVPTALPPAGTETTRDVDDGWTVPPWLGGRRDLRAAADAARAERAAARAASLRRLGVHDVVVTGTADVVPGLAALLGRSRRARR
jgi:uncharacterized protein (DUF58 family)